MHRLILASALSLITLCDHPKLSGPPTFDGGRAYDLLVQQCDLGPRNPGSAGHRAAIDFLSSELKKWADSVETDAFTYRDAKVDTVVALTNIKGVFNARATERILLCAHWDTRPYADQETDPKKRTQPIPGANDGASGVAVLLEVARVLRQIPPVKGVDIVLFDGEDYGRGLNGDVSDYFLGARRFAAVSKGKYAPRMGILLDMIGDKDLTIYHEGNSNRTYPDHVARVWQAAATLGYRQFIHQDKYTISDDHLPLIEAGIPCIDLIDFDYPPWHTTGDTPDKCSAQSLKAVGDVVLKVVYEL